MVKHDVVFFGEKLPEGFSENFDLAENADAIIVMGTSMKV